MKFKRLLSGAIACAMAATMLPVIPAMAEDIVEKYPYTLFAGSSEEGAITVNSGNFCVNGSVATNGTISASGNMNINGTKTENANEDMIYILKKLNYAYFTGENVDVFPDSIEEMNININDPMDVKGELVLKGNINLNTGIKAFEDVNLIGEVKNTSNAVICSETGDIVIDSVNANLNGLVYAPYGDVEITAQNLNLNNVVIIADTITFNCPSVNANYSSSMAELVGTESDIDVELFAFGDYNGEANSINIEWYTNYTNSDYEVLVSDDNVNYTSVATIAGETVYQYLITEDFETRYFKISLTTNYGEVVESVPFVVTKTEDGYSVDFLDSDGDGLADIYENMLGTDVNNPDTDGDGLTDYQEVYITGTNPTKYDSVTEGISDADADSDGDGLSNAQEIELGTDPKKSDTDDDGLSDGDEVNIYGTDPLKPDTDEDGVNDGDEIILGLDPLKSDTNDDGVPDCDEYFEQTVDQSRFDSDLFEDNLAAPSSLTVSAKGNVNSNINISEYTGYLKGEERAYVGKVIEITDSEIRSGSISFTLSEEYKIKNYEAGDMLTNGLLICYNDGENTTPLATVYDEETRTLKADISSGGIYFVLDVMSWLESLGLELPTENSPYVKPMAQTYSVAPTLRSASTVANVEIKGQVDIVFVIDTTGSMGSYITNVKNNITEFVNEIEVAGISPSFALVDYRDITCDGQHSTNVKQNNGSNWFKKADEFKAEISKLSVNGGGDTPESAIDGLEMARQLDLRATSQKFFVLVTDADYKVENNYGIKSMTEMIDLLINDKINVSVVSNSYYQSTYKSLYEGTGGIFADVSGNFKDKLLSIANMINKETNSGCWIALKGLIPQIVKLDENPTGLGTADTDGDTLLDREELKSVWPTRYIDMNSFLSLLGLPLSYSYPVIAEYDYYSNPTKKDTDGDKYDDNIDPNPMKSDVTVTRLKSDYLSVDYATASSLPEYISWKNHLGTDAKSENISFGGNQSWFERVSGVDKDNPEYIAAQGCGLIAMADTMLYMSRKDGNYETSLTSSVSKNNPVTFEEYRNYVVAFNNEYVKLDVAIDLDIYFLWWKLGNIYTNTNDGNMGDILNDYFESNNLDLEAKWCYVENGICAEGHWFEEGTRARRIRDMLKDDIPAIISVGPGNGIKAYDIDTSSKVPAYTDANQSISNHYFTITAVIDDKIKQKNGDYDAVMYEVSTWGQKYYISEKEIRDYISTHSSLFTNVLYIEEK